MKEGGKNPTERTPENVRKQMDPAERARVAEHQVLELNDELGKTLDRAKTAEQESSKDHLTGLLNRRGFEEAISRFVSMIPLPGHPYTRSEARVEHLTVVLLDIDHFKEINDSLGHPAGDQVLKKVAKYIQEELHIRAVDIAWRHGGEEFGIAFVGANAQQVLQKLGGKVNVDVPIGSQNQKITLSGGVAEFRPGEKIEETLKRADEALYKAKESGRNRILPSA